MTASPSAPGPDPRSVFGWCMYDWANSAYATTVSTGLLPAYFVAVVVPAGGVTLWGAQVSAATLLPFAVGLSALLTFLMAPMLGAIADFSAAKKQFLLFFAYMGSLATLLLYFSTAGTVWLTLAIFTIAQTAYVAANVFYDAFLPQIAPETEIDRISARGYSYGYVGGGLQFALSMLLVGFGERIGVPQDTAVRISLAMAGLWWAGFTLVTHRRLTERGAGRAIPARYQNLPRPLAFAAVGFRRTWETTKKVRRFRHLLLFLVAYMFYNDGIQTVLQMATLYGADELGLGVMELMLTLLMIQVVATGGALLFGWLAGRIGAKRAVMVSIAIWAGVVIYAYFIETVTEYFILGGIVGVVLGGSQALSRSFYGSMIPVEASAEFYGFYSVFAKFSAIWGPFVFGIMRQATGSSRSAILSLIVFFIVGLTLLYFVDEARARSAGAGRLFSA